MIRTVRESTILFQRNLRKLVRVPMMLFFSLFQPLLWLLLFTQIFKRLGEFPQFQQEGFDSYLMFFAPSVLTMTVLTSAFQSGMGMVTDLEVGMLDKFLISPIRRSSVSIAWSERGEPRATWPAPTRSRSKARPRSGGCPADSSWSSTT